MCQKTVGNIPSAPQPYPKATVAPKSSIPQRLPFPEDQGGRDQKPSKKSIILEGTGQLEGAQRLPCTKILNLNEH